MEFVIRPSTQADLAAVDALLARAYPRLLKADYPPSVLVTALPLISRAKPELVSCGTYYVAETTEGAIVGAGGWTPDPKVRDLGHIRHVVTDDRAVRQGVGRAVINHALAVARGQGMADMECWSTRTAVAFYASFGFVDLGLIDVPLQPGITFPSVRMRLHLSDLADRA